LKVILNNRTLSIAIAVSVLIHGVLLAVRFISPESFRLPPADPALEVVLVNAKHSKPPLKADALAQANLDGGGNADTGRAKSLLPDMGKVAEGENLMQSRRRVRQLQEQQKKMMAQLMRNVPFKTAALKPAPNAEPMRAQETGADLLDSSTTIARRAAEIAKTIEDQNKRPKKTYITPSTREVGYAMYYKSMQRKIENIGTLNFPQQNGKKLYGELTIYIPVFQDGTIYENEGGPQIAKTSGISALDNAALRIVRRAAPFGPFPANMRSGSGSDQWIVTTRFIFTREQALEAQMQSADN
jgi:protein TonB